MAEYLSDVEIKKLIRETCEQGEVEGLAEKVEILFVKEQQLPSGKLASSVFVPAPRVLLNKSTWKDADPARREFVLKRECCYLMACKTLGKTVKRDGAEYRYFALKTDAIEACSEEDLRDDFTILEPDQW